MLIISKRSELNALDEQTRRYQLWTEKGAEAYWSTRNYMFTLFGGAKGGMKTGTGNNIFKTDISNYRDGIFVAMRKNYTTLHQTTKQTFERFFPPWLVKKKLNDKWICVNNNELWWWAVDDTRDPNLEKTRGLEASAIFVDEASEQKEMLYEILPSLLRRPAIHLDTGEELDGYIYIGSNPKPGQHWLKRHFINERTRKRDNLHNFIQSLPDENPLLPRNYIERGFATMGDELTRMLRFGDWEVDESDFVMVLRSKLERLYRQVSDRSFFGLGIDIGLGRPDKTVVWAHNQYGHMWKEAEYSEYDTDKQVELLSPYVAKVRANGGSVHIDAGSVGKGVSDRLQKIFGSNVVKPELFGSAPLDEGRLNPGNESYVNRRAQLYFWMRNDVQQAYTDMEKLVIPTLQIQECENLVEELENTYYLPESDRLAIEPKDEISQRIGRSPDDADGAVLCNAARRRLFKAKNFSIPNIPSKNSAQSRADKYRGYTHG